MSQEKKVEVWDVYEWIRTAPLDDVRELIGWAKAVTEMRVEYASAQPARTRKKRSDAGVKRPAADKMSLRVE